MKKLILIFALFASTQITAQLNYHVSAGFDIANAIKGGTVNDRAIDLHFELGFRTSVEDVEVYLGYENFQILNFELFKMGYNKMFPYKRFEFGVGFNHGVIHRWDGRYFREKGSHDYLYSYALNAEIRFVIDDNWKIAIKYDYRNRTDIEKIVGSNEFKVIYTFNKNKNKK